MLFITAAARHVKLALALPRDPGYTVAMKRWSALLCTALLAGPAWGKHKEVFFIDTKDRPEPIGMRDPQEEMARIVKRIEDGELPKIHFEFDSDNILLESHPTLDAVADLLFANSHLKLMVLAHTCSLGTEQYNLDLSQRRAKSVKTYLVKRGIAPPSIRYRGLGYSMPIADNSTEEGRSKNRRVDFRVTTREWNSVY